jgi:hypothetical protein
MLTGEEMFDKDGLVLLLRIFFLDDKGGLDRLARIAFAHTNLLARPWVVCQWIAVLAVIHLGYKDSSFPSSSVIASNIRAANEEIKLRAVCIEDHGAVESDAAIGSDVANT